MPPRHLTTSIPQLSHRVSSCTLLSSTDHSTHQSYHTSHPTHNDNSKHVRLHPPRNHHLQPGHNTPHPIHDQVLTKLMRHSLQQLLPPSLEQATKSIRHRKTPPNPTIDLNSQKRHNNIIIMLVINTHLYRFRRRIHSPVPCAVSAHAIHFHTIHSPESVTFPVVASPFLYGTNSVSSGSWVILRNTLSTSMKCRFVPL